MRELSPLAFAWVRVVGSAIVLHFLARNEPRLSAEDNRRMIGYSILGVVINQALFLAGLSLTSVPIAAILITTIPIFALGAAIIAGRERATAFKTGGIALACAGALLVLVREGLGGTSWRSFAGALMIVGNCLSFATYLVISKPLMARLSARIVVARMFFYGTIFLLPVSAWSLAHQDWRAVSMNAWISLVVVIAGPTVGAYLINAWALRHADSSLVAVYTYVQPVLATLLGVTILGEELRGVVIVAGVMIVAGVWLAGRDRG
jgi:drug/metabolite transporter (DMT)-like permease